MKDLIINSVSPSAQAGISKAAQPGAKDAASGFGDVLRQSIDKVSNSMQEAEQMAVGLTSGKHANIHETMIALEKANISFRLLTKVQGKVLGAYQEIMRMQV